MSKILTVFGATGKQGGSVVKSVLAHPTLSSTYTVRAVTRNTSKPEAQALAKQGCQLVAADLADKASVEKAVQGAYAVFSVTDFWTHMSKDKEVEQGKAVADASKAAGVKLLIFSTLPHVTTLTKGQLKHVLHFDGKAEVASYIESIKGSDMAASYFMPAYYMSNLLTMTRPVGEAKDEYLLKLPWGQGSQRKLPFIDIGEDSGTYVAAILASEVSTVNGQHYQAASEWLTPDEVVEQLSSATGKAFSYEDADPEAWASNLPPAVASELKENMILMRDFAYYGVDSDQKQAEQDKALAITQKSSLGKWAKGTGHWQ